MSRINDALKQAQKNQPQPTLLKVAPPIRMQSLPPMVTAPAPRKTWLVPALMVMLIVAAIVIIGMASTRRNGSQLVAAPVPQATAQPVAEVTQSPVSAASSPVVAAAPAPVVKPVAAPEPPMAVNPSEAPKLQGIFYSPTSPSAILDGQTVRPGDRYLQYRVKEISKFTVTLTKPDGRAIKLNMN